MERRCGQFVRLKRLALVLPAVAGFALMSGFSALGEEGIALAIVYDTSGSMAEGVPAGGGKSAPKYVIANKALSAITDRISQFAKSAPDGAPRKIEVGLFVFQGSGARAAVQYGPFDAAAIQEWVRTFSKPGGATPLGNSIKSASKSVIDSNLSHKHIVIITDGMNTSGPKPEEVVPGIKLEARKKNGEVSFHFVAFDVDAKVFDPVKKLGATVLGASNEQQLRSQLEFIFVKKILLEDEEPARPADVKAK